MKQQTTFSNSSTQPIVMYNSYTKKYAFAKSCDDMLITANQLSDASDFYSQKDVDFLKEKLFNIPFNPIRIGQIVFYTFRDFFSNPSHYTCLNIYDVHRLDTDNFDYYAYIVNINKNALDLVIKLEKEYEDLWLAGVPLEQLETNIEL